MPPTPSWVGKTAQEKRRRVDFVPAFLATFLPSLCAVFLDLQKVVFGANYVPRDILYNPIASKTYYLQGVESSLAHYRTLL